MQVRYSIITTILLLATPLVTNAVSTSAEELAVLYGAEESDKAGTAVASAGDVDGDGYEDILIGAPTSGEGNVGTVYLVYGKSKRYGEVTLSTDVATMITFTGEQDNDQLGRGVAGIGDMNGDGYDDFAMGASYNDEGGTRAGSVYIVYGQSDRLTSRSVAGLPHLIGDSGSAKIGDVIAGAGDVNGDGYADMLVGGPETGSNKRGTTYLIYGSNVALTTTELDESFIEFSGETDYDRAGYSVAGIGDINGDGYDDIAIGAYRNDDGESNAGAVYLIYGRSSNLTDLDLGEQVQIQGTIENDRVGTSVAGIGDINGDGYDDFATGAIYNDRVAENAGAVYVLYGQAELYTDTSIADAIQLYGTRVNDTVGSTLTGLGDGNGDGFDDFAIGAPSTSAKQPGDTYIVYGQADILTDQPVTELEGWVGEQFQDKFGTSVAAADVDGDGQREVVVGAKYKDANVGAAYLAYLPIHNCDNSVALGGILANYPEEDYKFRTYKKNPRYEIVVERNGHGATLVNCKTDEIVQTLTFNTTAQRKILARVFTIRSQPMFIAVTRTKSKRKIKIFLYLQKKRELVLKDTVIRRWRPRGLRLKINKRKDILIQKGKEQKHQVRYNVTIDYMLRLTTDN